MHGQQNTEAIQFYKTLVNVSEMNRFGPNRTFNVDKKRTFSWAETFYSH
jgi:hypothetical protein